LKIRAGIPSVKEVTLDARPNETIARLKKAICNRLGIEAEYSRLLVNGKLANEKRRVSRAIKPGDRVVVDYLWARHLIIWGFEKQRRLRKSSIFLAGAGAIGNEVAKNLAMLGVGRIVAVDTDVVELSNTSRMVFFNKLDVGRSKAHSLAKNASPRYPHTEVVPINARIEQIPLSIYLDCDVIVCGLDNVVSRMFLAEVSRKYSIPMVDGGIIGTQARVQVHVPPDWPCPMCSFPSDNYARLVGLRNPCDAPVEEGKVPSLPTTISLVSSIQTQETIKLILGYEDFLANKKWPSETSEPLKGVLITDLKHGRFSTLDLKKNPNCFICGKEGTAKYQVSVVRLRTRQFRKTPDKYVSEVSQKTGANSTKLIVYAETAGGPKKIQNLKAYARRATAGEIVRIIDPSSVSGRETIIRLA
jgi:molybdopterin/thiamine biosynthesis adenylyltransferase